MGTHLRALGESYPMNTNMMELKEFSKILAPLLLGRNSIVMVITHPFMPVEMSTLILEVNVCISNTSNISLGIENIFTKYLKESCL